MTGAAPRGGTDVVIGVDVGGTKIAAGAVTTQGESFALRLVATDAASGTEAVITRMVELVGQTARDARDAGSDVVGVAVATPGLIDPASGAVTFATPVLPAWAGANLRERISAGTGLATRVRNDAHAAAWGEWRCGAGQGTAHMVMVTVGTGIGGGVIANGALLTGGHGAAGRIGHLSIARDGRRCWCGAAGCVEEYASGAAIGRAARAAIETGAETTLRALGRQPEAVDVVAAARAGDSCARTIVTDAAESLGTALATLVSLFDPEMLVVGGGVVETDDLLLFSAVASMARRLPPLLVDRVPVRRATLGQRAAVVGAALLAWDQIGAS